MARVVDYSWARPSPSDLRRVDAIGVIRYLGPGNHGRDLTTPEVRVLHDAGIGVGLVWETTTTAALAGWNAGYADVMSANRYADALGFPDHLPIFLAVDTDVTPAQIRGPIADTFRGAISQSKRPVRPYGECDVLDILCGELQLMRCGWQCMAWSRGRMSEFRCMYQTWPPALNDQVDLNELGPMPCDFLWHPTITFDSPMEGDMPLQDHEWDRLQGIVDAAATRTAEAVINTSGNVAGVARDVGGDTQRAGVADGNVTRQLISDLDAVNVADRHRVEAELIGIMHELQQAGSLPSEIDAAALASVIADKLTVVAKS